jgi:hypothetical protein
MKTGSDIATNSMAPLSTHKLMITKVAPIIGVPMLRLSSMRTASSM